MNYRRIYLDNDFLMEDELSLSNDTSNYLINVLRKKNGDQIRLFNGKGYSCLAEIILKNKKSSIRILENKSFVSPSGIKILLGQCLLKPEPFSLSIQKSTELGVGSITPLRSKRTVVRINERSQSVRLSRWKKIAINACEQCGEDWLPEISNIQILENWCTQVKAETKIVLYPKAQQALSQISFGKSLAIAVGPEGDFTPQEIDLCEENGFIPVTIGTRVLRAESAVISSLSAVRTLCGEF